jgi:hypothetical protein
MAFRTAATLLCALSLVLACGGSGPDSSRLNPIGDGGDRFPDAGDGDGDGDGDGEPDSGMTVVGNDGLELCSYDAEDVHDWAAHDTQLGLSIATDQRGFALVHHDRQGALVIESMEVGRPAEPSARVVADSDAPGRALVATVEQRFAMLFGRGDALAFRLLTADAELITISTAPAASGSGDALFALLGAGDRFVVAYAEADGAELALQLQAIDVDGELQGDPTRVALPEGTKPQHLELAALPDGHTLLAWSEQDEDEERSGRVLGVVLTPSFEIDGEPKTLSKSPVDGMAFSLDARESSAGLLYESLEGGIRPNAKLQRIERDGVAEQPTLNIVNAPGRMIDASITAFGQGYAIAYRALSSLGVEKPVIRIAFVNEYGLIVHEAELRETDGMSGPTALRATTHGELLVAWSEVESPSANARSLRALQLDCPGALVLCGGTPD